MRNIYPTPYRKVLSVDPLYYTNFLLLPSKNQNSGEIFHHNFFFISKKMGSYYY